MKRSSRAALRLLLFGMQRRKDGTGSGHRPGRRALPGHRTPAEPCGLRKEKPVSPLWREGGPRPRRGQSAAREPHHARRGRAPRAFRDAGGGRRGVCSTEEKLRGFPGSAHIYRRVLQDCRNHAGGILRCHTGTAAACDSAGTNSGGNTAQSTGWNLRRSIRRRICSAM